MARRPGRCIHWAKLSLIFRPPTQPREEPPLKRCLDADCGEADSELAAGAAAAGSAAAALAATLPAALVAALERALAAAPPKMHPYQEAAAVIGCANSSNGSMSDGGGEEADDCRGRGSPVAQAARSPPRWHPALKRCLSSGGLAAAGPEAGAAAEIAAATAVAAAKAAAPAADAAAVFWPGRASVIADAAPIDGRARAAGRPMASDAVLAMHLGLRGQVAAGEPIAAAAAGAAAAAAASAAEVKSTATTAKAPRSAKRLS